MKKVNKRTVSGDDNETSFVSESFIKNESFLKRFLSRFLSRSHDIEDVLQETYIKARSAEQRYVVHSPKSFLFRIAKNEALRELKKKSRRITDYIEELGSPSTIGDEISVEQQVSSEQKLGIFCQAAVTMPPRCRQVFLMCKVYGFSYKEIAVELEISVSAVEKHVAKGLEICSMYMQEHEKANTDHPDSQSDKLCSITITKAQKLS